MVWREVRSLMMLGALWMGVAGRLGGSGVLRTDVRVLEVLVGESGHAAKGPDIVLGAIGGAMALPEKRAEAGGGAGGMIGVAAGRFELLRLSRLHCL